MTAMTQSPPQPRPPIQLLPEGLINKIAAGEVVERPASVAKELLENAIDAGATRISIAVEDGGRTLIRISDDGCGIPPEQAALAFAQHATSKITTSDDLFAITTMGFRGEALASIASVSHAAMTTRTADQPQGVRIEVRDSVASPAVPCAAPVGTTIEIRDLFYSVPARRKFLRTDATEFGHVHEMVLRSALPNPQIAISLTHNGRSVLELPVTFDHQSRISAALGAELHDHLMPIGFSERGVTITGFAGQPSLARATAKYQYLFLNGRFIRDRSLFHAIKEAYRGLIEPQSQPVAIVFLSMDPATFDVNVHPQKTEVRFRESNLAYGRVLAAIREKLLATDLTPQVRTAGRIIDAPAADVPTTREVIADFFRQPSQNAQTNFRFTPPPGQAAMPSPLEDPSRITSPAFTLPPRPARTTDDLALVQNAAARLSGAAIADAPDVPIQHSAFRVPHFIQLHNTYLVVETPDGVMLIDQHALHERIIYEELFNRATRGPLEGQRLLIPETLPVNPRQQAALETIRDMLGRLGIEITPFDAQSVAVQSFPSLLSKVSPREFLRDLLDKVLELGSRVTPEELLHETLDMASCKAAVKAGYPLSQDEIAALLAKREQIDRSSNCPHGRPTTLRLSINDLERQFKRK